MKLRDLLLPVTLLLVVAMMVFPLPLVLLDFLLVCNITLSLALLLGSVYLSEPERFTSLPTVLLLATLFRLGLNISTTRQLLGQGQAPDVVIAFGQTVVGGNLLVGIVIFLIVTLVQFLVIAKGAERVAEVAARFTLDAMPGKQMAIDADVRAGILSLPEAREKRRDLQRESKLYGALDGAMKFVKGDAIAGLVITAINIFAGLIVGVFQQRLALSQAAYKYSIFTVGDGLVSQIPALLTAVGAGIAVTRVADREGSYVGREVLAQLGKEPQALAGTSAVLLALALVPGFSFPMFGGMSLLFLGFAAAVRRDRLGGAETEGTKDIRQHSVPGFSLALSPAAVSQLQREATLPARVVSLRQQAFDRYGVIINDVPFEIADGESTRASVLFHGVPVREVVAGVRPARGEDTGEPCFSERVAAALASSIEQYRTALIDDTQTRLLLETHQPGCEDLINATVPKLVSVTLLTRLLRALVAEYVSIRSFSLILQSVGETCAELDERRKSVRDGTFERELLIAARIALGRGISHDACSPEWKLSAWMLGLDLDHLLSRAEESSTPIAPDIAEHIEAAVERAAGGDPCVILSTRYARKGLAELLAGRLPHVRVLSAEELVAEVRLTVLGEIILGEPDALPENATLDADALSSLPAMGALVQ